MHMYMYTHVCIICVYIYIYKERGSGALPISQSDSLEFGARTRDGSSGFRGEFAFPARQRGKPSASLDPENPDRTDSCDANRP